MNGKDILDLVFSPLLFFQRKTDSPTEISSATVIVIVVVALYYVAFSQIVSSIARVPLEHIADSQYPEVLRILELSRPISQVIVFFSSLQFLFYWGLGSLFVIAVCTLFNVDLRISKIAEFFGQSYLPFILFLVFVFSASTFFPPRADASGFLGAHTGEELITVTEDYMTEVRLSPLMVTIRVLYYAFWVWVLLLWIVALKAVAKLSILKSIFIVGSWAIVIAIFNVLAYRYVK